MKEWRSKKQLEEYLMEKQRWEIIGFVTHKTLKKWKEEINCNDEDMYVLQKGKEYFYLIFRNYFRTTNLPLSKLEIT